MFQRYVPNDDDLKLFSDLIEFVHQHPQALADAARAFGKKYSTAGMRKADAEKLREHRRNPNHVKKSRTYRRRTFRCAEVSPKLSFEVGPLDAVLPPERRERGEDGKLKAPAIPLKRRFLRGFNETFADSTVLHKLQSGPRMHLAATRVLVAWLYIDPDRDQVERISEFQDLRTEPSEDGIGPLWYDDEPDPSELARTVYVYQDGSEDWDAPKWIKAMREAFAELQKVSAVGAENGARDNAASQVAELASSRPSYSSSDSSARLPPLNGTDKAVAKCIEENPGINSPGIAYKLKGTPHECTTEHIRRIMNNKLKRRGFTGPGEARDGYYPPQGA